MVYEIRYKEDLLPFENWFILVLLKHCGGSNAMSLWDIVNAKPRIETHVHTPDRREIDIYIVCKGKRICIELKEADFERAVNQAVGYLESGVCDISYVAINLHTHTVIDFARSRPDLIRLVFEHGIGVVSVPDKAIVFRAYERKSASRKYMNLLELVKSLEG